ncbi:gliding motility-associated C-terminal domain-containing protein [Flavobacterium sp.]|uniref:T9SS type B sorting domain-containing protein n=1 Tax=Flavobacterium sp. TaxID=239 RepID=UPI00286A5B65|nr:gliding motility-associated C-terminal domain-containing protein [Flavobacterium sp.]
MRKELYQKQYLFILIFFFLSQIAFSQLTNFTLTVTKTDESCSGNGSLSFSVSSTTPDAIFVYSIYLLPNTLNPIGVTSSNAITGLVAGNYRVVALQSLGNLSNSKQQDIQILNTINPLAFQVSGEPVDCIHGNITIAVTQGNPATYEIISGPVIVLPQVSNVLQGLTVGEYVVRVNDVCGDGIVQTFTLANVSSLNISPIVQSCDPVSCLLTNGDITISTAVGATIYYPLIVQTTIFPPNGGTPVITTQTITSGNANLPTQIPNATANLSLAIITGETYTYTINVTDVCGNNFIYNGSELIREGTVTVLASTETEDHLSFIRVKTCNLVPPFYVNFITAPEGFNPNTFNSQHPGPFASSPIEYLSTKENQLPLGDYEVAITDSCGNVTTGLGSLPPNCEPDISATPICATFGLVKIRNIATLIITSAPAGFGFPIPYDATSAIVDGIFLMQLPLGTYTFEGIDRCGEEYTFVRTIDLPEYSITAENQVGCESNTGTIRIKYATIGLELAIVGVRILSAPAAFLYPLPFNATQYILLPISRIEVEITGLPPGDYVLEVVDYCGNIYPLSVTVPVNISTAIPSFNMLRGCTQGYGSVSIDTPNRRFTEVIITAAPPAFAQTLPYNVSFNISTLGKFYMNDLPEGTYAFSTIDVCGIANNFEVVMPGYNVIQSDVNIVENCGSFNLILNHVMDQPYMQSFWLQKLDPVTNQWKHPYTGTPFVNGDEVNATNSFQVYNYATNFNIALYGKFRVVKVNSVYSNGSATLTNCGMVVIKEFEFTGELRVINATGILCNDSSYNTFITVAGVPPFTFKITTKDGEPFFVDNGNSNYFSNLTSGTYNFQIEDHCGNVVNRVYDITTLLEPAISQSNLCDGQNGKLIVPAVSFLSYQWWNANAPTVILSTTNALNFTPFYSSTAAGTYFVHVFSNSSLSCLDKTLSYTIPTVSNPQAGNDNAISLCADSNPINLFSVLGGNYDTTGNWTEITNSGMLSGNTWIPTNIPFGVYRFKYHVDGFCDDFDEAVITINFKEVPEIPIITSNAFFCLNQPFQLNVNAIANVTYEWTGPNNFTSSQQNPTIANPTSDNAGLYTIKALLNGCESTNSITVAGESVPDFDLKGLCKGAVYNITVVPNHKSFDVAAVSYLWSGPNNFSSTVNPIDITGFNSGQYTATVTNSEGCSLSKNIVVSNTFCGQVPLGISPNDDDYNDEFDLTGLGKEIRFEVFNRYGTMVYKQDDYTNQWHGQDYKNRMLPDATYYYYIKLKSGEEKTGWVYVTR